MPRTCKNSALTRATTNPGLRSFAISGEPFGEIELRKAQTHAAYRGDEPEIARQLRAAGVDRSLRRVAK